MRAHLRPLILLVIVIIIIVFFRHGLVLVRGIGNGDDDYITMSWPRQKQYQDQSMTGCEMSMSLEKRSNEEEEWRGGVERRTKEGKVEQGRQRRRMKR